MRALWHALHESLVRSVETRSFHTEFTALRHSVPELHRFRDPAALFDHLHGRDGDPVLRNATLRALVAAGQSGGDGFKTCTTLMLLALWPGLDAVHGRLSRYFYNSPEELTAEISTRVTFGVQRLDLDRVTWIAATLIRNTERDIVRKLVAGWRVERRRDPLPDQVPPADLMRRSAIGLPDHLDPDAATRLIASRLRTVVGTDTDLVIAVAIDGERQCSAAERLGLTPEAVRKRYQRALRKLRPEFVAAL